jgi:hypothetical protein
MLSEEELRALLQARGEEAEAAGVCREPAQDGVVLVDLTMGEAPEIHGEPGYNRLRPGRPAAARRAARRCETGGRRDSLRPPGTRPSAHRRYQLIDAWVMSGV